MTLAPMTAQDMNAIEIPAMPFMRPEDEELETLRSDICGLMFHRYGIAPLNTLLRYAAHNPVDYYGSRSSEEELLRHINSRTHRGLDSNSILGGMHTEIHAMIIKLKKTEASELPTLWLGYFLGVMMMRFGLDGMDVLEFWHNRDRAWNEWEGLNPAKALEALREVIHYGVRPVSTLLYYMEMAATDANEERGIF